MPTVLASTVITIIALAGTSCYSYGGDVSKVRNISTSSGTLGLGSACQNNETCTADVLNSYCTRFNQCECDNGYVPDRNNSLCLATNSIRIGGGPCQRGEQCMGYNEMSTVCLGGLETEICDCALGFIHNNNLTKCLPIVNDLDSTFCSEDIQCHFGAPGELSRCVKKQQMDHYVCKCAPNAIHPQGNHTCLPKAVYVGDDCHAQSQCTTNLGFSRCVENKCQCNPGYEPNPESGTACVPQLKPTGEL